MPRRNRHRARGSAKPPASCVGGQTPREFQERERVPVRLGDDPFVSRPCPRRRGSPRPTRLGHRDRSSRPGTSSGSPVGERRAWCARRTATRPGRRAVAERRTPSSAPKRDPTTAHRRPRRSAVVRRPDPASRLSTPRPRRNRSGGFAAAQARRPCPSASRCGSGNASSSVQHRAAELVKRREREFHLRLHTDRAEDPNACGRRPRSDPSTPSCRRRDLRERPTLRCRRAAPRRRAG